MVLSKKLLRVFMQIEQLRVEAAGRRLILDELPVPLPHTANPRLLAATVDAVQDVANGLLPPLEHRQKTRALVRDRRLNTGDVAERGQRVAEVDVARGATSRLHTRPLHDEGHPPGVFVEILLALQAVATDRHAMVGRVEDPRVVELAHRRELLEHPADLPVDIFTARVFAAQFIANRVRVPAIPHSAHRHLVADIHVAMIEGVPGQPVAGQRRLLQIGGRRRRPVGVVGGAVFCEQFRRAVASVVRMREPEVDQERVGVLRPLPLREILHDPVAVPAAATFVGAFPPGGVVADREEFVGTLIGIALLAGPHRVVTGPIENRRERELNDVWRARRLGGPDRQVPYRPATHHHVPARRADRPGERAHVIRRVKHHSFGGKPVDHRRVECRGGVVAREVEGRLVVGNDVEDVGPFGHRGGRSRLRLPADVGKRHGPVGMGHMLTVEDRLHPRDHIRMLNGDIPRLGRVGLEIVEFRRMGLGSLVSRIALAAADGLPPSVDRRLPLPLGQLAVEGPHRGVCLAAQHRREAHAVEARRDAVMKARQIEQRRQPVLTARGNVDRSAGGNPARPDDHRGHTQAPLVGRPLPVTEGTVAREPCGVDAAGSRRRGSVVAREHEDRVVGELQFVEQPHDAADFPVHPRDHRGIRRQRPLAGHVSFAAAVGLLVVKVLRVVREGRLVSRNLERQMRHGCRDVQKKWTVRVRAEKLELFLGDQVCGIGLGVDINPLVVIPEMIGVVGVRLPLAVVAVESVEARSQRVRRAARCPQPPFAEAARRVAGSAEPMGKGHGARRHRGLSLGLDLTVAPHHRMAGMHSRHEHAATGRTDRASRPVPREPSAPREKAVDFRRVDVAGAEGGHVTRSQIVAEKKDDVGWPRPLGPGSTGQQHRHERDADEEESVPHLSCHASHLLLIRMETPAHSPPRSLARR